MTRVLPDPGLASIEKLSRMYDLAARLVELDPELCRQIVAADRRQRVYGVVKMRKLSTFAVALRCHLNTDA